MTSTPAPSMRWLRTASHIPAPAGDAVHDEDEDGEEAEEEVVESVGGDDVMEEVPERPFRPRRQYKIQEVIKRRQVMLVQVVKEERGNKGAALTTYLSLAGRYAVLMPNTARGGGISRKITSAQDRSRLKEVVQDLDVPEGMGIILRTAGAARTKPEIKRDFEYLIRMWETVRDLTLKSQAPTLVYEEGSLIKRSLRDLYNKEIDEIQVAGEAGYGEARDFMKMLMPASVRAVKLYRDGQPLFSRMGVESQLDAMFSPTVQLRSGGYIVINQTEALVSIDVNSGRATREHHIEDTALKTNLEAAEEVARQLRLRDLAGPDRHRLHRHGREAQQPRGRTQAVRLPPAGSRAHPGRPHLAFRPAGNVAPAHPRQRAGKLDRALPAMRRHRPCPFGLFGRAAAVARHRGNPDEGRDPQSGGAHPQRRRALCAEPQARPSARSRKRLQGLAVGRLRSQCQRPAVLRHRPRRAGAYAGSGEGADRGAGRGATDAQRRSRRRGRWLRSPSSNPKWRPRKPKASPRKQAKPATAKPNRTAVSAAESAAGGAVDAAAKLREASQPREDGEAAVAEQGAETQGEEGEAEEDESEEQPSFARGDNQGGERRPRRRGRRGGRRRRGGNGEREDGLAGSISDELAPPQPSEAEIAVADFDGGTPEPAPSIAQPEPVAASQPSLQPEDHATQAVVACARRNRSGSEKAARRRSTVREKVSFGTSSAPAETPAPVAHSAPEPAPAARRACG